MLSKLAEEFSPRYEVEGDRSITIDISGLGRLLGTFHAIGGEIAREAAARGIDAHVAMAGTCTAARILARARPGLTVVLPGEEAAALAPLRIEALATNFEFLIPDSQFPSVLSKWGIRTLGAFAALPAADIRARLGCQGVLLQALARGEDVRPLVPDQKDERFEATLDLEWPIEGLEPLSFVLTRLLEPLSTRLERRDRAAAALHVALGLVAGVAGGADAGDEAQSQGDLHVRRLEFPTPLREVRTLRTLALIDMESHPPGGPIERVTVTIEPTPGRVLQHTLFSRAEPTPDELSTLLARLAALLGAGRIGAPAAVDSYRPGAFGMRPFNPGRSHLFSTGAGAPPPDPRSPLPGLQSTLRRFRHPVPVRVAVEQGRPIRVVADRRGFGDSRVVSAAGPWRSSGNWWSACGHAEPRPCDAAASASASVRAGGAASAPCASASLAVARRDSVERRLGAPAPVKNASACGPREESESSSAAARASGGGAPRALEWSHEEWDVAMADGAVYRLFRESGTGGWFLEAIVD